MEGRDLDPAATSASLIGDDLFDGLPEEQIEEQIENGLTIDTTVTAELQQFILGINEILAGDSRPQVDVVLKELARLPTTKDVAGQGHTMNRITKVSLVLYIPPRSNYLNSFYSFYSAAEGQALPSQRF